MGGTPLAEVLDRRRNMTLINQVKWGLVTKLTPEELREHPSMELMDEEGNYFATLIIPSLAGGMSIFDNVRIKGEFLGVRGNSVLPQEILNKEILDEGEAKRQKMLDNLVKARAARKDKLVKV